MWAAERFELVRSRSGSLAEMAAVAPVWGPDELGGPHPSELWTARTRIAWVEATDLDSGRKLWVPAQAAHCPAAGQPSLGPTVMRWTSNGMGAHPSREAATLHALLEAIERDQLARALPRGWTREAVRSRMLAPASLLAAPRTAARARAIEAGGFRVFLFDLAPRGGLGLPVAGALLADFERGPVPLTAGYACAPRRDEALLSALLEAAQSRLTDVHGAREDVSAADPEHVELLRGWCEATRPGRSAAQMPDVRAGLDPLVRRLSAAGHRAAAVELAPPSLGIHVVKALVSSFLLSELL